MPPLAEETGHSTVHTMRSILLSTHLSTHIPLTLNSALHPGLFIHLQLEFLQFLCILQLLPALQLGLGHSRPVSPQFDVKIRNLDAQAKQAFVVVVILIIVVVIMLGTDIDPAF